MDAPDKTLRELQRINQEQAARIESQTCHIEQLTQRIEELELQLAKARKNSSNSSKSPSSDIVKPKPKPPSRKRGRPPKRRQGGQPGHTRQLRRPLPPERVDETIEYQIQEDEVERLALRPTGEFDIIQRIELPETPIHVTEHRLTVYQDLAGNRYVPNCPELRGPIFGPRLLATIGWLKSVAHCSYSTMESWMEDVLQVPVSRGYLAKLCTGTISQSLAGAYAEVQDAVPQQTQLGSDETSFKDKGKKHWIWCLTCASFRLFHIAATRSREVLEKLVGPEFSGYLNFDYFSANCSFAWNYSIKAQYCWSHLIRELRFLQQHPDEPTRTWSEQLLDRTRRLFSAWHRRDEMTAEGLHRSLLTHRDRFMEIMRAPPVGKEANNIAARFALVEYRSKETATVETYDMSQDYFRFLFEPGIEPTNNHNEQQLRHSVIDRRITQGTRSALGQRYHERMWTAIATCQKQQRNFFRFLHESLVAQLDNRPGPSLIR